MKIVDGDTVVFKSGRSFYEIEECGLKPNTVRVLDEEEARLFADWIMDADVVQHKIQYIEIQNKHGQESFRRKLTDVSFIGSIHEKYLLVFSWRHEGEVELPEI